MGCRNPGHRLATLSLFFPTLKVWPCKKKLVTLVCFLTVPVRGMLSRHGKYSKGETFSIVYVFILFIMQQQVMGPVDR